MIMYKEFQEQHMVKRITYPSDPRAPFQYKAYLSRYMKKRRSWDCLIYMKGDPTWIRRYFLYRDSPQALGAGGLNVKTSKSINDSMCFTPHVTTFDDIYDFSWHLISKGGNNIINSVVGFVLKIITSSHRWYADVITFLTQIALEMPHYIYTISDFTTSRSFINLKSSQSALKYPTEHTEFVI